VLKNKLKLALAVTIFSVIPMLCKHRGIFHRTWFVVLLIVLIAALLILHFPHCQRIIAFDALFFMVGALSHLWLDLGWRGMLRR
jgi:general stress protein CsbA